MIYIYVYIYIYICVCTHIYIYTHTHTRIPKHADTKTRGYQKHTRIPKGTKNTYENESFVTKKLQGRNDWNESMLWKQSCAHVAST